MPVQAFPGEAASCRFGWRDVLAFSKAFPRIALRRKPRLAMSALARVSAMDIRRTPRQLFFLASDGGRIAYRTYAGSDDIHLVLIHGSACFGDQFHLMARHLSSEGGATVHTLDMRGHGQSVSDVDGFARYAQDVAEFVEALQQAGQARRIVVGGHSAGGGLIINIARARRLKGVAGWLLLAPFVAIADRSVKPYFGGWVARFRRFLFIGVVAANGLGIRRFNHIPLLRFDREICLHDPRYAREWPFDAIFGFGPGPSRPAQEVIFDAPVLLTAGDRDECFEAKYFSRIVSGMASDGDCRIFEGLGHWDVLVDEGVLDTCRDWLRAHCRKATGDARQTGKIKHANFG